MSSMLRGAAAWVVGRARARRLARSERTSNRRDTREIEGVSMRCDSCGTGSGMLPWNASTGWMHRRTKGLKPAILVASGGHGRIYLRAKGKVVLAAVTRPVSGAPTPLAVRPRRPHLPATFFLTSSASHPTSTTLPIPTTPKFQHPLHQLYRAPDFPNPAATCISPARKCDPSELEGGDMELDQGKSQ
ncbi:hypothetical protein [Oryza sativa Japonica Group]|uniref:Uncharacterized protein n=1 Tax=Oryza sativa subsp. japonica TaxID=39947 RepID=Q5ZEK4_ORYSJ|nr:hypothetical protein [Oryza sativa Japonica Group]BAD68092.1 hypothetical protein [Oryza sativa Japonica Group]